MTQFIHPLSTFSAVFRSSFYSVANAMGRNLNPGRKWLKACMLVVTCLLVFFGVNFSIILIHVQRVKQETISGLRVEIDFGDYMDLDGETVSLPLKCNSCALVGTSGYLLDGEFGKEIDEEHSCIFRIGFSPTRGLERNVGSRTTARIADSYRFYPFLKKPTKLITGPFAADLWILFDRRSGDILRLHGPHLTPLAKKHDSRFIWMTRNAEKAVLASLVEENSKYGIKAATALWFATKVIKDAGCNTLNVYGIPDSQICKRHLDVSKPSLYWENTSLPLCVNGEDASFKFNQSPAPVSILPTVFERKSLPTWGLHHLSEIHFYAPSWPT